MHPASPADQSLPRCSNAPDGGGFSWSAKGEDNRPKGMAWRIVETEAGVNAEAVS